MIKYLGGAYLPGYPRRDLSDGELQGLLSEEFPTIAKLRSMLVNTGLYKVHKEKEASENDGGLENGGT